MNREWRTELSAVALGLGVGTIAGALIFDNLGLGISLGLVFGVSLGQYWRRRIPSGTDTSEDTSESARFIRSRDQRMLFGVCGGLSERYGWNTRLVRLLALGATVLTGILAPIVYLLFPLFTRSGVRS